MPMCQIKPSLLNKKITEFFFIFVECYTIKTDIQSNWINIGIFISVLLDIPIFIKKVSMI